jgi:hypothetical protein
MEDAVLASYIQLVTLQQRPESILVGSMSIEDIRPAGSTPIQIYSTAVPRTVCMTINRFHVSR